MTALSEKNRTGFPKTGREISVYFDVRSVGQS